MKWLICLLMSGQLLAVDYSEFDLYQEKLTRGEIEEKLMVYLKKDPRVDGFFELTDETLTVFDALPTFSERNIEYVLKLAPQPTSMHQAKKRENLVGVKVAIDPGHFGGPFSRLEERYIDIPPSLERTGAIQFDEGTLSLLTAHYLKLLLEKEGAIVYMTRTKVGEGGHSLDFFQWLKENPQLWSAEMTLKKLFKSYNQIDLHARADKINAFNPDLTIVIHYNSHTGDDQKSSNSTVTPANFNMVFVPGAFFGEELMDAHSRHAFLRLVTTDDLKRSHELSQKLIAKMTETLRIPSVVSGDGARYLESACLKVEEGIYARNLALTRLVHGPVSYGETLVQNNVDECLNLNRKDFVINGIQCSSRVKQVAEAYFEGIKTYFIDSK